MAQAPAILGRLRAAGEAFGLADVGIYAVDALRLEKGYRAWKQDLTTEYSALAAGLDRFVRLDKPDFPGRAALLAERASGGPADRLVPLLVDDVGADAPMTASVLDGDTPIGIVTSGGWGHRLGRSLALAYVRADLARPGQVLAIDIYGTRASAVVTTEPLYDPANARLKA